MHHMTSNSMRPEMRLAKGTGNLQNSSHSPSAQGFNFHVDGERNQIRLERNT